jgi:hypothetical protein
MNVTTTSRRPTTAIVTRYATTWVNVAAPPSGPTSGSAAWGNPRDRAAAILHLCGVTQR